MHRPSNAVRLSLRGLVESRTHLRILRNQPIRRQIVAATCALMVPFVLAIAWSSNRTRLEREAEVTEQAGSVAVTAAAYLSQYLTGIDSMASALTLNPVVVGFDRTQSDKLFSTVLQEQPLLLNVVLTDTEGAIRGTALPARANQSVRMDLPYVKAVLASGKPVVSEMIMGVLSGKPTIVLAYPVRDRRDEVVGGRE